MNSSVDRFKKRQAVLGNKAFPDTLASRKSDALEDAAIHSGLTLRIEGASELISAEADDLLAEIRGGIDREKFSALIDACQKECLQAVIRPFGIGRVLFEDKLGGNVATIHNVRNEEYQKDNNTAWASSSEKRNYEQRKPYEYNKFHDGNKIFKESKKNCESGYDIDHPLSCINIHNDPAIYLTGLNASDVANLPENHVELSSYYNRAKGSSDARTFVNRLPKLEEKRKHAIESLKISINKLETSQDRTEEQNIDLGKKRKALEFIENAYPINPEKLIENEDRAKYTVEMKIKTTYYTGKKFIKNTTLTSLNEGGKMALQQALGVLMEEFVRAAFAEVKDVWGNGFKGAVDETFLEALKKRLERVIRRVSTKWKDSALTAMDGGISGFLSNIVTVIINAFVTTSARIVRMLREGFMSLYRALKILAFPPEGLSVAEAADAASKLLATGLVTAGGIALDAALEPLLQGLGPLAPYVSSISVGFVTGLCTAFAVYLLDQLDLFGATAKSRHDQVLAKLDGMISISYERALEAASVFDGPAPRQAT